MSIIETVWAIRLRSARLRSRITQPLLYLVTAGALFVGLFAHAAGFIIVARSLGSHDVGLLAMITTASSLGAVLCEMGSGEIARRRLARDPTLLAAVVGHGFVLIVGLGLLICVVLIAALMLYVPLEESVSARLWVMLLLVPSNVVLYSLILFAETVFLARNEFRIANAINVSFGIGRAVIAAIACFGFGVSTLDGWAAWHCAYYIVVAVPCCAMLLRLTRPTWRIMPDEVLRGASSSASYFVIVLRQNADILALSAVASPAVIGCYSVARRVVGMAGSAGAALDRILYNKLAVAGSAGAGASLLLAWRFAGYVVVVMGSMSLGLFLVAPLLPLVVGDHYVDAINIVRVLCWMLVPVGLQNLALDTLNSSENHAIRLAFGTVAALAGTALIVHLTLSHGVGGATFAVFLTELAVGIAFWMALFIASARVAVRAPRPEAPQAGAAA